MFNLCKVAYLPSQWVTLPVHVLLAWQCLTLDPFKINPSSQLKVTKFGNVVLFPSKDPFWGIRSFPQSLAERQKENSHINTACTQVITENVRPVTLFILTLSCYDFNSATGLNGWSWHVRQISGIKTNNVGTLANRINTTPCSICSAFSHSWTKECESFVTFEP